MVRTVRRALLTGGTGFVGGRLARHLEDEGWEVHLVLRPASDPSLLRERLANPLFHVHDGTTEGMCSLVEKAAPHVVFHLAGLFLPRHEPGQVEPLVRSNVLFGSQLLEAMDRAGAARLVNAGTSWQSFHGAAYRPVNLYAATKEAFEAILAWYVDARSFGAATLRLFDTYGPGDRRPKLVPLLLETVRKGGGLDMSPGDQRIDLVHVDDAARAFEQAGKMLLDGTLGPGHDTFAVTSGDPLPLRELVGRILRAWDAELPIRWGGREYREREVMEPWTGGRTLPGWEPRVPLEDGARALLREGGTP